MKSYLPQKKVLPAGANSGRETTIQTTPGMPLKKVLLSMMCLLIVCCNVFAQQKTYHGKVVDKVSQAALPGATVSVKGKTDGTTTDQDGNFSVNAIAGDQIIVASVGYTPVTVNATAQDNFLVELEVSVKSLDDVVVVGYGTRKKRDLTGAVSSVKVENSPLSILPNANMLDAVKGSLPGLDIGAVANAGGNPSFEIRGQNSIKANNGPLVVVDGVIFVGSFNEINPNDIATVDVLKDASAASVYGSRGANGVILITTKRGQGGKPTINVRATTGVQTYTRKPDMRDGPQFIQFRYDAKKAAGASPSDLALDRLLTPKELQAYNEGHTVNWWDEVVRIAPFQDYQINFSGGNDRVNYYISGDYLKQDGIVYNDNFKKFTVLSKIEAKITDWMKYGLTLSVANKNADGVAADLEKGTINAPYAYTHSTFPGFENWLERYPQASTTTFNPLWKTLTYDEDRNTNYRSLNYVRIDAPWVKGLSYTFNYALNRWEGHASQFNDEKTFVNTLNQSELSDQVKYLPSANGFRNSVERTDWYMNHLLNYNNSFGDHSVDVTLLAERQDEKNRRMTLSATDFSQAGTTVLGVNSLELGDPTKRNVNTDNSELAQLAYLARVNYIYKNRYYLTASYRRDGYSAFAEGNQFGNFAAASAAWAISDETFFKNNVKFINFLKLRVSYGETGNPSIGAYSTFATIGTSNYLFGTSPVNTTFAGRLPNKKLKWEVSKSTNYGIDFSVLRDIISGSLDYYDAITTNLLIDRAIPVTNGFATVSDNIGKIQNKGIEIKLNSKNITTKNFRWSSGLNFWLNRNKIVSLYGLDGNKDGKEDDDISNNYFIGKSLGAIYDLTFDGIVQTTDTAYISANAGTKPGDIKYVDLDGNGKVGVEDRSVIGYSKPNYSLGFSNTFNYKKFELYFMFFTVQGGGKDNYYLAGNQYAQNPNALFASVANWLDKQYWTPETPSNTIPRLNWANSLGYKFSMPHSFVRLQDLSLSYQMSDKILKRTPVKSVKAYIAGKNLLTFTNWDGLDPETATNYASVSGFPVFRTVTLGLSITL